MSIIKKNITVLYFFIFSIIGFVLRILISNYGYNHDSIMWQINMELLRDGKSFYEYGKYNYSPFWVNLLVYLDSISLPFFDNKSIFRIKIIIFLSTIDYFIFLILYKKYSLKIGLLFFLNPISIFITGFHNQFDNIAILLGFIAMLFYEKNKNTYKFCISLIIFGLSICAKQILFFFPLWLAIKERILRKKILIMIIPYFIFFISFYNYLENDFIHIMENVINYKSYNNGPFWGMFAPKIVHMYIEKKTLFFIAMILLGFYFQYQSFRNLFYYYLICVVIVSSGIFNQYFAIPLVSIAVFWNRKYLAYTILCCLLFLIDGDALNINFLKEFFDWNLRSTRIMYYPIILLLLLAFLENIVGKKKFNLFFLNKLKLVLEKIKEQFYLNK